MGMLAVPLHEAHKLLLVLRDDFEPVVARHFHLSASHVDSTQPHCGQWKIRFALG
jgi:hypothetical protein